LVVPKATRLRDRDGKNAQPVQRLAGAFFRSGIFRLRAPRAQANRPKCDGLEHARFAAVIRPDEDRGVIQLHTLLFAIAFKIFDFNVV
jgi:hypothetical protein